MPYKELNPISTRLRYYTGPNCNVTFTKWGGLIFNQPFVKKYKLSANNFIRVFFDEEKLCLKLFIDTVATKGKNHFQLAKTGNGGRLGLRLYHILKNYGFDNFKHCNCHFEVTASDTIEIFLQSGCMEKT